ncbi:IST1-like protein [Drosera capensis]
MLDGLLGRGAFYTKCKGLIKMTRTRIEAISRKRNATLRFLRKDIADLIACGLEDNAYGRTGGLLAELVLTSCYDFVGYVCEIILKQLATMQKNSECPEDCREAVASLMYAAARFSDLPELRDLRNIFQERYGSSLEFYVNQKLVENIAPKPPSTEKKIQLIQEIASEFSLKWDSWGFEKRMANPSASKQDPPKEHVPHPAEEFAHKPENLNGTVKERNEAKYKNKARDALLDNGHHMHVGREGAILKENKMIHRFPGPDVTSNGSKQPIREENFQKREELDLPVTRRLDANGSSTHQDFCELKDAVESRSDETRVHDINRKRDHGVPFRRRELTIDSQDSWTPKTTSKGTTKAAELYSSDRLEPVEGHAQFKGDGNRKLDEPKVDMRSSLPQRRAEKLRSRSEMGLLFASRNNDGDTCAGNGIAEKLDVNRKLDEPKVDRRSSSPQRRAEKLRSRSEMGLLFASRNDDGDTCAGNGIAEELDVNRKLDEPKVDMRSSSPQRRAEKLRSRSEMGLLSASRNDDGETCAGNGIAEIVRSNANGSKPNFRSAIPPPYVKPRKTNKPRDRMDLITPERSFSTGDALTSLDSNDAEQLPTRNNLGNSDRHHTVRENEDAHGGYTNEYYKDDNIGAPTPRRRSSSRRRRSKPTSSGDGNSNAEEDKVASRRRGESRKGLQIVFDDDRCKRNDEEEKMIDKLLQHYCQKPPTVDYTGARRHHTVEPVDASVPLFDEARNGTKAVPHPVQPPARSVSVPRQQPLASEPKKVFSRAASFQPDMLSPAKHVHPKLPDYDDLAARFAALKRNKD